MFNTVRQSSSFDGIVIDDLNERPLTIALATIIMVWLFAFALTFAWSLSEKSRIVWRFRGESDSACA